MKNKSLNSKLFENTHVNRIGEKLHTNLQIVKKIKEIKFSKTDVLLQTIQMLSQTNIILYQCTLSTRH